MGLAFSRTDSTSVSHPLGPTSDNQGTPVSSSHLVCSRHRLRDPLPPNRKVSMSQAPPCQRISQSRPSVPAMYLTARCNPASSSTLGVYSCLASPNQFRIAHADRLKSDRASFQRVTGTSQFFWSQVVLTVCVVHSCCLGTRRDCFLGSSKVWVHSQVSY